MASLSPSNTPSSDESAMYELSFDYEQNSAGEWKRVSKGRSSPPTPVDKQSPPSTDLIPPSSGNPSPPPSTRLSLTRSESLPGIPSALPTDRPDPVPSAQSALRSFQRALSGPVSLPQSTSQPSHTPGQSSSSHVRTILAGGLRSTGRSAGGLAGGPRRVTLEEYNQINEKLKIQQQQEQEAANLHLQDEKENHDGSSLPPIDTAAGPSSILRRYSPPRSAPALSDVHHNYLSSRYSAVGTTSSSNSRSTLADVVPVPQRPSLPMPSTTSTRQLVAGPSRLSRVQSRKFTPGLAIDKISEVDGGDDGGYGDPAAGSETDGGVEEKPYSRPQVPPTRQRVNALTHSTTRPRRSASLSDASTPERPTAPPLASAASHSGARPGTSMGLTNSRTGATRVTLEEKRRRDRETALEDAEYARAHRREEEDLDGDRRPFPQDHIVRGKSPSPTHIATAAHLRATYGHQRHESDTLRSAVGNLPPPQPQASAPVRPQSTSPKLTEAPPPPRVPVTSVRHRRSPTSDPIPGPGDDDVAHVPVAEVKTRNLVVSKKAYARLDLIGKGGSSRVYRVMNNANEIYAIKRVSLDKTDAETMSGYMNEIALLKRLNGNSRIIRLVDSEVKPGPGGTKGHLMLVMECGEIDFARLLQDQQKEPLNLVWVAYYWQQMLQAVHVIHEEKIVHSDLKPANFVLVRGQLKLIDFGIANAIANDTTNIQRDHQIGTVNYMSPEAIELPDGMRRLKVGRPSDVWSLGCILYQMVYGHPPFQHLSVYQKMKAIPDTAYAIDFPEHATPTVRSGTSGSPPKKLDHLKRRVPAHVIACMKKCLSRNPKERVTIPELLEQEWLGIKEGSGEPPSSEPAPKPKLAEDETIINPYYMRQLLQYGIRLGQQKNSGDLSPEDLLREATRLVAELKAIA